MSRPFSEIRRPMTPERRESIDAIKRSMEEAERCYLCHGRTDDLAVTVNLGTNRLGLLCSYCQDDATPLTNELVIEDHEAFVVVADEAE